MSTAGFYRNRKVSIDSVKKRVEFQGMKILVDRPKGFRMEGVDDEGKPWSRTYQYDYGFFPKTDGGDNEGLDVYVGPDPSQKTAYWVVQKKKDGSFDEYKVLVGFSSAAQAKKVYEAHGPPFGFKSMAAMSIDMMKSLLGVPSDKVAFCLLHLRGRYAAQG